jgi:hypothetical protein
LTCLGITAALHAASLVTGDAMHRKWSWFRWIAGFLTFGALLLAFLGALALFDVGFTSTACTGSHDAPWFFWILCQLSKVAQAIRAM